MVFKLNIKYQTISFGQMSQLGIQLLIKFKLLWPYFALSLFTKIKT